MKQIPHHHLCFRNYYSQFNLNTMGNILYAIALILVICWLIGFTVYNAGNIIHILLVVAVIAVLLRVIQGKKVI